MTELGSKSVARSRFLLSEAWALHVSRGGVRLERAPDGGTVQLPRATGLTPLLSRMRDEPVEGALLLGATKRRRRLVEELESVGVLRRLHAPSTSQVRGEGRLRAVLDALLTRGGWRLPPIFVEAQLAPPSRKREAEVVLGHVPRGVAIIPAGAEPCGLCLRLRLLGREVQDGRPGLDQTRALERARPAPLARVRRWVARALTELQQGGPGPGQAILVREDEEQVRSEYLAHPDCPACAVPRRPRTLEEAAARTRAALGLRKPAPPEVGARRRLVDAHAGPVQILEEPAPPGKFPLEFPLIWGSVFLTRNLGGKAVSTSTYGGVHATAATVELARVIALSESVERLAARAVRPDVEVFPTHPAAVPLEEIFSAAKGRQALGPRPHCFGLELVRDRPCLLPFESVVVALPRALDPHAFHREPYYSGCASHVTLEQAVVNATVELLKRDAFMISWYRQRALPRLAWPRGASSLVDERAEYLQAHGVELELFDLRLDAALPTLLLKLTAKRGRKGWPQGGSVLVPAGGFHPVHALEEALRLATWRFAALVHIPHRWRDPLDPKAVREHAKVASYWPLLARYLNPRHAGAFEFLRRGPRGDFAALPSFEGKAPLAVLRESFAARKREWLVVRLTDEPARAAGFETVKVVVPGLVGLASRRRTVNLSAPRMLHPWPDAGCTAPRRAPHPLY